MLFLTTIQVINILRIQCEIQPEIQQSLRQNLESKIKTIRDVTIDKLSYPEILIKDVSNIYTKTNNSLNKNIIENSIKLSIDYHKKEFRDNQDPYVTHPLSVGYILADIGADNLTVNTGILHDIRESCIKNKDEQRNLILSSYPKYLNSNLNHLIEAVTHEEYEDAIERKKSKIVKVDKLPYDLRLKGSLVLIADCLHNALTLDSLKDKDGRSALFRRNKILGFIHENILSRADEVDRMFDLELNLKDYLVNIIQSYKDKE